MATKPLLSLQNNDQLVSNLKRGTKALQKRGGGGQSEEVAPAYQVITKLKKESSVALHGVSHSMLQRLQNVIKQRRGNAGY